VCVCVCVYVKNREDKKLGRKLLIKGEQKKDVVFNQCIFFCKGMTVQKQDDPERRQKDIRKSSKKHKYILNNNNDKL